MPTSIMRPARPDPGPAWDIARLFPDQGCWDEDDYLLLDTNHLVEFTGGRVEVLPMPKPAHQRIVLFLYGLLHAFISTNGLGEALVAPMPVRLRRNKYREPDVMFMLAGHADRKKEAYWEVADLVAEVVSDDPKSRERDLKQKRREYARARIPEYWIVDPHERRVTVLRLAGKAYAVHGEHAPGERAASALLDGFEVDVAALFDAAGK